MESSLDDFSSFLALLPGLYVCGGEWVLRPYLQLILRFEIFLKVS